MHGVRFALPTAGASIPHQSPRPPTFHRGVAIQRGTLASLRPLAAGTTLNKTRTFRATGIVRPPPTCFTWKTAIPFKECARIAQLDTRIPVILREIHILYWTRV